MSEFQARKGFVAFCKANLAVMLDTSLDALYQCRHLEAFLYRQESEAQKGF